MSKKNLEFLEQFIKTVQWKVTTILKQNAFLTSIFKTECFF